MKAWKKGAVIGVVSFFILISSSILAEKSPQEMDISACLAQGYSENLCIKTVENIAECSQTESLNVCEDRYYAFAEDMAKVEADIERSEVELQKVSVQDQEYAIPEHNTKIPPELKVITDRVSILGGRGALNEFYEELNLRYDWKTNPPSDLNEAVFLMNQTANEFLEKKRLDAVFEIESIDTDSYNKETKIKFENLYYFGPRLEWVFGSSFNETSGIKLIFKEVNGESSSIEKSNEVFERIHLKDENGTLAVVAQSSMNETKSSKKIRIVRDKKSETFTLYSNGKKAEISVDWRLEKSGLFIKTVERDVNVIPNLIFSVESVKSKEFGEDSVSEPVYEIRGFKSGKFFGLFSGSIPTLIYVNSLSGEIISIKKPWWSFLVW